MSLNYCKCGYEGPLDGFLSERDGKRTTSCFSCRKVRRDKKAAKVIARKLEEFEMMGSLQDALSTLRDRIRMGANSVHVHQAFRLPTLLSSDLSLEEMNATMKDQCVDIAERIWVMTGWRWTYHTDIKLKSTYDRYSSRLQCCQSTDRHQGSSYSNKEDAPTSGMARFPCKGIVLLSLQCFGDETIGDLECEHQSHHEEYPKASLPPLYRQYIRENADKTFQSVSLTISFTLF